MAAIKALQQWCKTHCEGYRDVDIVNMTTSFRDGLAFCALIHKFRPDLISFETLSKDNVYDNNHMAFRVAEDYLGIPALLDAEDMVALAVPDRLSILTYVSQYYNYFNGRSPTGGVGGVKRPAEGSKEEPSEKKNLPVAKIYNPKAHPEKNSLSSGAASRSSRELCPPISAQNNSTEKHVAASIAQKPAVEKQSPSTGIQKHTLASVSPSRMKASPKSYRASEKKTTENTNKTGTLNSKCAVCKSHVHLVQRYLVDGKLYHRSCFKCSKCLAPLQSGAYKVGHEMDTLLCSSHHCTQNGHMSSPKSLSSDPAEVAPKSAHERGTSLRHVSVLTSPVKTMPKQTELSPAPQPWTASAQRTQEARQKFFLSTETAPSANVQCPIEVPVVQNSVGLKTEEEKERARALITKKLAEGNCNNNNRAYSSGLKANKRLGSRHSSDEVPSWMQERLGSAAEKRRTSQISPSPTATSSKEAFWLSAISKEHSRPSSTSLSIARAKDVGSCEEPADWQSKLNVAANGQVAVKNVTVSEVIAVTPEEIVVHTNSNSQLHDKEIPSAAVFKVSNSTLVADHSFHLSPVSHQTQHGSSDWDLKNEIHVSPFSPSNKTCPGNSLFKFSSAIASSPEVTRHGAAGWAPECESFSSPPNCKASEQPLRGLTGSSSRSGYSKGSSCHNPPVKTSPPLSESCKSKAPTESGQYISSDQSSANEKVSSLNSLTFKTISSPVQSHHIPMEQITKELQEIEDSLSELEKEGIELERKLRRCEEEGSGDILVDPLMVDWFNLIRKKQCYIRRESELVYIAKTQDLEEQQPGVVEELRRLLNKPEHLKSTTERKRETYLMNRLVEIVNDRNAIVEGLEEDRLREEEEDQQLNEMMERLCLKKMKSKRKPSISKLFRRRSKKISVEG